jgi:excisionase family DNA binding protein
MEPLLLTAPQVADVLGLSVPKVYQLIRDGVLPSVRVDAAVRVPRVQLEAWIRERTQPATASQSSG